MKIPHYQYIQAPFSKPPQFFSFPFCTPPISAEALPAFFVNGAIDNADEFGNIKP